MIINLNFTLHVSDWNWTGISISSRSRNTHNLKIHKKAQIICERELVSIVMQIKGNTNPINITIIKLKLEV